MPTLLYGLTLSADARTLPASVPGIGDDVVRALEAEGLAALVSTVTAKPRPTLAAIRAHDGVLQRVVDAGGTVAAVRFGQVFADDPACVADVRARGARVRALLEAQRGCVEMRVLLPAEEAPPAASPDRMPGGPGREYLESLRAARGAGPRITLAPMLGPIVRAERVEAFGTGKSRGGVAVSHLVHRDDVADYRDAVRALPALEAARVVGPLALYSFAEPDR